MEKASATSKAASLPKAFEDISSQNTEQTTVQTEVYTDDGRIDILLLNEVGGWAMIIENKVCTTERSNQLDRYYQFIKKKYPDWQVFGIYLTLYGDKPSHEAYSTLNYGTVCEILDEVLGEVGSMLSDPVRLPPLQREKGR